MLELRGSAPVFPVDDVGATVRWLVVDLNGYVLVFGECRLHGFNGVADERTGS